MKIQAVIFDWAGTVVDYGCNAPVVVLQRIFEQRGVPLEPAESRHAMGLLKIDQIREILAIPRVRAAWRQQHGGSDPEERDVQEMFQQFIPLQMDCIEEYWFDHGLYPPDARPSASQGGHPRLSPGLYRHSRCRWQRPSSPLDDL